MDKKVLCIVLCIFFVLTGCKGVGTEVDTILSVENNDNRDLNVLNKAEFDRFNKDICGIFKDYDDGHMTLYVKDISNNLESVALSRRMQAASLIKLYVAGSVYENYKDVCEYFDSEYVVEELMRNMISASDNEALNELTMALGRDNETKGKEMVNEFCKKHDYEDTHMGRLLLKKNQKDDNYTSVKDCGKFLYDIYTGEIEGAEEILGYMKQQERVSKIPQGIPPHVTVANKTGELSDVENDVAIVFLDTNPYIICIMADKLDDTYKTREIEAELSEKIYLYMCGE